VKKIRVLFTEDQIKFLIQCLDVVGDDINLYLSPETGEEGDRMCEIFSQLENKFRK